MPKPPAALPWPLHTLDFEASALDDDSYPIEVGLALWPAPKAPIYGWSTLIRPTSEWLARGRWSEKARAVHGIARGDLARGRSPEEVVAALNAILGPGGRAWCDGGEFDAYWLRRLFAAAAAEPAFVLAGRELAARLVDSAREHALSLLQREKTRHRAREDAQNLVFALACALGLEPGPPQDLERCEPRLAPGGNAHFRG